LDLSKTIEITLLSVLSDEDTSTRLTPSLWSMFHELESFYASAGSDGWLNIPLPSSSFGIDASNASSGAASGATVDPDRSTARVRPRFGHRLLSGSVPPGMQPDKSELLALPPDFGGRLESLQQAPSSSANRSPSSWDEYQSRVATPTSQPHRQFDARVIGAAVQEIAKSTSWLLIVADYELTPPPTWRYIVWDVIPSGAVVSIAPIDPVYWSEPVTDTTHRTKVIKMRARAACMSVIGSLLGLQRCDNPNCFLYANVDSVVRLDDMAVVGPEHGVAELTGRGFAPTDDPATIDPVATVASPSASASG
jgi:predicted Zn-dependent protease